MLESLRAKGLVISLTSEGRGHVVSHALYLPDELASVRAKFGESSTTAPVPRTAQFDAPRSEHRQPAPVAHTPQAPAATAPPASSGGSAPFQLLTREIEELRALVTQLRSDLSELADRVQRNEDSLQEIKSALGG